MQIGIGEWTTVIGRKAKILAHNPACEYAWVGFVEGENRWRAWSDNGRGQLISDTPPIIAPWVDPVTMDWAMLPGWANNYVTMDQCGKWWSWDAKPVAKGTVWSGYDGVKHCCAIPEDYAPKWTGDWMQSLTAVPHDKAADGGGKKDTQVIIRHKPDCALIFADSDCTCGAQRGAS